MRTLVTLLTLCLSFAASGCWGGPEDAETLNVLPYPDVDCAPGNGSHSTGTTDTTSTNTDTQTPGTDNGGTGGACDCIVPGMVYRFDSLGLTALDGEDHPVIATLNPLWLADMQKTELNVLFEVLETSAETITFRAVNAARVGTEGDMCVLEDTGVTFDFPRSGCALEDSTSSAINVYAGDEDHPKNCTTVLPVPHAIPVQQVILEAELSNDCGRIENGLVVSGVIGQQELLSTCTCLVLGSGMSDQCGALDAGFESPEGYCKGCNDTYINLETLLVGFGDLDYKCTTLTDGPGVCIEGYFSAALMDAIPPSCGE